ncbi:unnamed protein product [Dibothriocephalus latus]|uniref:Uncharacterized protein n=1 Tax=Dibothriocephalus latus TaxID=60516 RepID=A0A3P6SA81_DIBLA|nr:unnamed protein product [Dibothriocephalus latus]
MTVLSSPYTLRARVDIAKVTAFFKILMENIEAEDLNGTATRTKLTAGSTPLKRLIWSSSWSTAATDQRPYLPRCFVFVSCREIQSILHLVVLLNLRASGQSSIRTKGRCSSVPKKLSFLVESTSSSSSATNTPRAHSGPIANCKVTSNQIELRPRQVQNAVRLESRNAAQPVMPTLSSITARLPFISRISGKEPNAFVQSASSDPILQNRYLSNDGAARLARWTQVVGVAENSILKTSSRRQHGGLCKAAGRSRVRLSEVQTKPSAENRTRDHANSRRAARSPSTTPVHRERLPRSIQPLSSNGRTSPAPVRALSRAAQSVQNRTKTVPIKLVKASSEGSLTIGDPKDAEATPSGLAEQEDSLICGGPSVELSIAGSAVINIPVLGFFRSGRTSLLESLVQSQPVYSATKDTSSTGPSYYCPIYVRALREQILLANIDVPMVIVANKVDLLKRAAPAVRQFADLTTSGSQMRRLNRSIFCRGIVGKGSSNSVSRLDLPQSLGFSSTLPLSSAVPSGKNMVRRELAVLIKKHWKNCVLVECSAIYNFNVLSILKEVMKFVQCREAGPKPTAAQAVQAAWVRNQCSIL